ncbi:hypothetical protein FSP39_021769 [Pinctada imbricata]|uniref:Uncharacterized protein n=1 Tax=Pinctada imbricata TaxID=66713 RepID=A0AA89BQ63_PINIB|nr:hypothetical protein FSP39_021769 [Pinctada imbricata]
MYSKVTKADKLTGRIIPWTSDYPEFGEINAVDIIPKDKKPDNSLCRIRKGDCSTFCFPTPTHRVCGCEDGVKLLPDGKRCENGKHHERDLQ